MHINIIDGHFIQLQHVRAVQGETPSRKHPHYQRGLTFPKRMGRAKAHGDGVKVVLGIQEPFPKRRLPFILFGMVSTGMFVTNPSDTLVEINLSAYSFRFNNSSVQLFCIHDESL